MCGIIGCTGQHEVAAELFEGLKRLEYRGYDSWGIATLGERIDLEKTVGPISSADERIVEKLHGTVGVAHTRWATHGGVSVNNAHPHLDCTGTYAVVHNGIFENDIELRKQLLGNGHKIVGDNDSILLPHMMEENPGKSLERTMEDSLQKVIGMYGIVAMSKKEPQKLVGAMYKQPVAIGIGKGENFLASDPLAFIKHTNRAVFLEDYDIAVVYPDSYEIFSHDKPVTRKVYDLDLALPEKDKSRYPFMMGKEISQQTVIADIPLKTSKKDLNEFTDPILSAKKVYITAAGTSYHAGLVAQYMLGELFGVESTPVVASEFRLPYSPDKESVVIAISQSGETKDTLEAFDYAKDRGAKVLAIVNRVGSQLARKADKTLYIGAGAEVAVAATKTYTNTLITIYSALYHLAEKQGIDVHEQRDDLSSMQGKIKKTKELNDSTISDISTRISPHLDTYFIGKGIDYPTALEGALKLKEISGVHAQGFYSGELKHGPLALIEKGTPLIAIIPENGLKSSILNNAKEALSRGAEVYVVAEEGHGADNKNVLRHARVHPYHQPIVGIVPLQMLAYNVAIMRGRNPDYPPNLAKSVTVA